MRIFDNKIIFAKVSVGRNYRDMVFCNTLYLTGFNIIVFSKRGYYASF